MGSIFRPGLAACGVAASLTLLGAAGCSPASDAERAYIESRATEQQQREQMERTLEGGSESAAAIDMAKRSPAEDGPGTAEQWIERLTAGERGTLLFPRWEGLRRSLNKYEVRYSYTVMNESGNITKKGYAWEVDLMVKTVTGPRDLEAADLAARSSPYFPRLRPESPRETPKLEE
jgi:hypothetical protein